MTPDPFAELRWRLEAIEEAEAIRQWACKAFEAAYSRNLQRDYEKD
jgi:hypothetical protein